MENIFNIGSSQVWVSNSVWTEKKFLYTMLTNRLTFVWQVWWHLTHTVYLKTHLYIPHSYLDGKSLRLFYLMILWSGVAQSKQIIYLHILVGAKTKSIHFLNQLCVHRNKLCKLFCCLVQMLQVPLRRMIALRLFRLVPHALPFVDFWSIIVWAT